MRKKEQRRITNFRSLFLRENIKKKPTCLAFMTAKQREKNNTVSEKKNNRIIKQAEIPS